MGSFSDYLEAKLLDHVFGKTNAYTAPTTLYLALFTVTPSDSGGGTEASGGGYSRLAITNNTTNFPNATGSSPTTKTNGADFAFPAANADVSSGSNMVAWGLFDASSNGNLIAWGALSGAKPWLNLDTFTIPSGLMSITLD